MEIIAITNALNILTRLRKISKNIEEAEFKNLLAELASELADVKLEVVALKEQLASLQLENQRLMAVPSNEEPIGTRLGCYEFEGEDGLYCTACWDTKRLKARVTRATSRYNMCPVCKAVLGVL